MISIIITSYKEPHSIGHVIEYFLAQNLRQRFEIIVVAPDEGTLRVARRYEDANYGIVRVIKDESKGKPASLNLAIKAATGDILIFTDGDVLPEKNAISELIKKMEPYSIVTGRPVLMNIKETMLNWWGNILFDTAHQLRLKTEKQNKMVLISGYLWATTREVLHDFTYPENLISEDEYLSYISFAKGIKIIYAPLACVKVKYPENISDWLKQKVRTLGGTFQIKREVKTDKQMRSFVKEVHGGLATILLRPKNLKEWCWLIILFFMRLFAWFKAFWLVKILKKEGRQVWKRIESTKQ